MENEIKKITKQLLKEIGENPDREGLIKTPSRVAKAWQFFSKGYKQNLDEIINNAIFFFMNVLLFFFAVFISSR